MLRIWTEKIIAFFSLFKREIEEEKEKGENRTGIDGQIYTYMVSLSQLVLLVYHQYISTEA